ncbi:hypothetical protein GKC29_25120 [Micromonospora sp. WMMC415]|uniref:hypothetical protein n=1 Tax=Micromonospora sp. WMMC415 TaxID=2675222 RepID=UPI0012B444A1|nr:hypothetical protein [Micromonospora sp. WMMC415]QGN49784.1 hypothetical protein GKC29_25120 [Micromonospora sp. WMMC415]
MRTLSKQADKWLGRVLVSVGCVIAALCLGLMGYARSGDVDAGHTWNGDAPAYLTSAVRGGEHQCTITPDDGEARTLNVPSWPNRGPHVNGRQVDPWFAGTAQVSCTDPVYLTQGWMVRLYPLVEQWLVLLAGLVLALVGLNRLGLFRHTSRYP